MPKGNILGFGIGILVGAGASAGVTYYVLGNKKTRFFVNMDLITYVSTMFGSHSGDAKYNVLFDVNKDGTIDAKDVAWFADKNDTWVELPV